jgi:hypothetical protein
MDALRFDGIARLFAARRISRREVLAKGSAGLTAAALAAAGLGAARAAAQEASPAAATGEKTMYLFVQSFQAGSIAPKAGEDGTYTLTLERGLGQTIYFSNRPERIVGAAPTAEFLKGLGFAPANPPNAALVVEAGPGNEDIAVLELLNPRYDEATKGATYDAKVLEEWERSLEMGFSEAPTDPAALAPSFGAAHLFIDDCPDLTTCVNDNGDAVGPIPGGPYGQCFNWQSFCQPDNPNCNGPTVNQLNGLCDETYDACDGACLAQ